MKVYSLEEKEGGADIYRPPLDSLSFLLYIIEQVFVILPAVNGRKYEKTIR